MAEKFGIPLDSIDEFPQQVIDQLASLWITTAEELVDADKGEGGREGLVEYLGVSDDAVGEYVQMAEAELPIDFDTGEEVEIFGLGAMDEAGEDELGDEAVSFEPLPPKVDLHERMPPIRNQGGRGTCVAFTCTAVREYLLGDRSADGDLSEQFLYWDCKQRDGHSGSGTWIKVGMEALKEDGICIENMWPYNPVKIQGDEGQGPPPETARTDAASLRISDSMQLPAKSVHALKEKLADQLPLAFAVPVYTYWFRQPVRTSGDIRMPLPTENVEGGHAMCMVGYEDNEDVPGGGFFIVRNSWGTDWGSNNVVKPGYCRIPYAYMADFGLSAHVAFRPAQPEDGDGTENNKQTRGILEILIEWLKSLF